MNAQENPYADLSSVLAFGAPGQTVDSAGMAIQLDHRQARCDDDELELGRFGGVIRLAGSVADGHGAFAFGQLCDAAGEIVITSQRVLICCWTGQALGTRLSDAHVVCASLPWAVLEQAALPAKTKLAGRVAGGRAVSIISSPWTMMNLSVIPRSRMRDGQPCAKASSDDLLRCIASAGAASRLSIVAEGSADRQLLDRLLAGQLPREGDELVAVFGLPEGFEVPLTPLLIADPDGTGSTLATDAYDAPSNPPKTVREALGPAPSAQTPDSAESDVTEPHAAESRAERPSLLKAPRSPPTLDDRQPTSRSDTPSSSRKRAKVGAALAATAALSVAATLMISGVLGGDDTTQSSALDPADSAQLGETTAPSPDPEPDATRSFSDEDIDELAAGDDGQLSDAERAARDVVNQAQEDGPVDLISSAGVSYLVPVGEGWELSQVRLENRGRQRVRELTGPQGERVVIVHTPDHRAQPDPDLVYSDKALGSTTVADARILTLDGFPKYGCGDRLCDDYVLNEGSGFGGMAILANDAAGPSSRTAERIALTVVGAD